MGKRSRRGNKTWIGRLKKGVNDLGAEKMYRFDKDDGAQKPDSVEEQFKEKEGHLETIAHKGVKTNGLEGDIKILKGDGCIYVETSHEGYLSDSEKSYICLTELPEAYGKYLIFYKEFCNTYPSKIVYAAQMDLSKRAGFSIPVDADYRIERNDFKPFREKLIFEGLNILVEHDEFIVESDEVIRFYNERTFDYFLSGFVKRKSREAPESENPSVRRNFFTMDLEDSIDFEAESESSIDISQLPTNPNITIRRE